MPSSLTVPSWSSARKTFDFSRLSSAVLGSTLTSSLRVEERTEEISRRLIYEMTAFCLTDHLITDEHRVDFNKTMTAPVPATWWDHFRIVHHGRFWGWAARRWPPHYVDIVFHAHEFKKVAFHRDHLYPGADIGVPANFSKPIVVDYYTERPA